MRVLVVGLAVIVLLGGVGGLSLATPSADQASNAETEPGEDIGATVLMGEAELHGEVEVRSYALELRTADDPEERARVIAERVADEEARLAEIDERLQRLESDHEAGDISTAQYHSSVAVTAVELATIDRIGEHSVVAATDVADLLDDRGVSIDRIERLRTEANELSGPEVAEIARHITGAPDDRPPVDISANESEDLPELETDDDELVSDDLADDELDDVANLTDDAI